jgi:glycosyltransferase involved in cell wall biosynthesis
LVAGLSRKLFDIHVGLYFSNFHAGGIQRVRLRLAESLLHLGWRVDLVVVQGDGPLRNEIPARCRLFDFQAKTTSRSLFKLIAYLRSEKPGTILSSQTHLNVSAVLARILSGWKGRLVLSEHIALDYAARNPANWKDRFLPLLARIFYRRADEIILVSKGAAQHFMEVTHLPKDLIRVIYNPIVIDELIVQSKTRPEHAWFSASNTPVILAVGRLTKQKDFGTLLRAFSLLRERIPLTKLIILGEGKERSRLEQLSKELGIQNSVQLLGFVMNPFSYMANASVLVLSSRWEGFPNVLTEALACGTPVVSTDCPSGPAEILENGRYGSLTPVGDAHALAEAILSTINHPPSSAMLRKRAMDFSIENIIPQYLDVLRPGSIRTSNLL